MGRSWKSVKVHDGRSKDCLLGIDKGDFVEGERIEESWRQSLFLENV